MMMMKSGTQKLNLDINFQVCRWKSGGNEGLLFLILRSAGKSPYFRREMYIVASTSVKRKYSARLDRFYQRIA